MIVCPTCGNAFEERGFHVLVPGLGAFDRAECALAAVEPGLGEAAALIPVAATVVPMRQADVES